MDRILVGRQRRGLGIGEGVDADNDLLAALDRLESPRVGFDQLGLEGASLNRFDGPAHRIDRVDFR